jgi:hypothetical protein
MNAAKNLTKYKCSYCMNSYNIKDNYSRHVVTCELLYKMRTTSSDEYNEMIEQIPDNKVLFYLLKQTILKCDKLEKEVQNMKIQNNNKQKKQIIEYLDSMKKPMLFDDWYPTIKVERQHLHSVFEGSLIDGFKEILRKKIKEEIPIMGFTNKPNTLYVYKYENMEENVEISDEGINIKWTIMINEDISKILHHLNRELIKEFLQWQRENDEKILSNEKMQNMEVEYMMKINGTKCSFDKIIRDIKRWIFDEIQRTIVSYDVV